MAWLEDCQSHHQPCEQASGKRPSIVVDVDDEQTQPRSGKTDRELAQVLSDEKRSSKLDEYCKGISNIPDLVNKEDGMEKTNVLCMAVDSHPHEPPPRHGCPILPFGRRSYALFMCLERI